MGLRMQPRNEKFFTRFSKAGSNVLTSVNVRGVHIRRSQPAEVSTAFAAEQASLAPHTSGSPSSGRTEDSYSADVTALTLREITDENRDAVVALSVAPAQERFVGTVARALMDAQEIPEGKPWYRAIYAGDEPVGFVMLSWNVDPQPPRIIGPWFLWKLLVDERHQRRGYGREAVRLVADIVRAQGATELLTSCVPGESGPEPFYLRIGFSPTGELDENGEIILALDLGH
jgi:diamine N-acetyltransferase